LREITLEKENKLLSDIITIAILDISMKSFTVKEVQVVIKNLNLKNSAGLRSHNQSNPANVAKNKNKIHQSTL